LLAALFYIFYLLIYFFPVLSLAFSLNKNFIIYTLFADLAALLLNTAATGCHGRWTFWRRWRPFWKVFNKWKQIKRQRQIPKMRK